MKNERFMYMYTAYIYFFILPNLSSVFYKLVKEFYNFFLILLSIYINKLLIFYYYNTYIIFIC